MWVLLSSPTQLSASSFACFESIFLKIKVTLPHLDIKVSQAIPSSSIPYKNLNESLVWLLLHYLTRYILATEVKFFLKPLRTFSLRFSLLHQVRLSERHWVVLFLSVTDSHVQFCCFQAFPKTCNVSDIYETLHFPVYFTAGHQVLCLRRRCLNELWYGWHWSYITPCN